MQTNKCTLQTRKERKVTVQSASKNQNIVAVPGNANWVNKEIVLTSKKNIVQRRIERLLCKVQAGVGNIVTLPKEGGVGRGWGASCERENGSIAVCSWPGEDIGRFYPQVQGNQLIKRELRSSMPRNEKR